MSAGAKLEGLHHVTMISGDARENVAFYTGTLGLRLIKLTVNFDDPGTYHLYYGDGAGSAGTILTFFPYGRALPGRRGAGEASAITMIVPLNSLDFWKTRLPNPYEADFFGVRELRTKDPDGLELRFREANETIRETWEGMPVAPENAIVRIGGVELTPLGGDESIALLTERMGMTEAADDGRVRRFSLGDATIDLLPQASGDERFTSSAGTIHHVAFAVRDDAGQELWLKELNGAGTRTSEVRDRNYFHSIYFREPGGILFEIATNGPGFLVDEPRESLGTSLKLPPEYEAQRARIESVLPDIHLGSPEA